MPKSTKPVSTNQPANANQIQTGSHNLEVDVPSSSNNEHSAHSAGQMSPTVNKQSDPSEGGKNQHKPTKVSGSEQSIASRRVEENKSREFTECDPRMITKVTQMLELIKQSGCIVSEGNLQQLHFYTRTDVNYRTLS